MTKQLCPGCNLPVMELKQWVEVMRKKDLEMPTEIITLMISLGLRASTAEPPVLQIQADRLDLVCLNFLDIDQATDFCQIFEDLNRRIQALKWYDQYGDMNGQN